MVEFKLLDKNNIDKNWVILSSMIAEVLKHTHGEETELSVKKALLNNDISIVLLCDNDIIEGFFTINPCGNILYIPHTYINKGKPREYLNLMNNKIEEIGKIFSCKSIRAYSNRAGMKRRLKNLGWKSGYVEYIKEINV
jgi:hypothetical protein